MESLNTFLPLGYGAYSEHCLTAFILVESINLSAPLVTELTPDTDRQSNLSNPWTSDGNILEIIINKNYLLFLGLG